MSHIVSRARTLQTQLLTCHFTNLHFLSSFWRECQEFKGLPASQIPAAADRIFKDFLALDSPSSINIDGPTLEAIKEATKKPTRYMFDAAEVQTRLN